MSEKLVFLGDVCTEKPIEGVIGDHQGVYRFLPEPDGLIHLLK